MSTAVAAVVGYLIGSIPTANAIAGMAGIDLRSGGSGNPGARNALRLGGRRMAIGVLLIEALKGAGAVLLGGALAAEPGMVAAGVGAVAGNVFNVWYRFAGGKGLGVTLGVLIAAWPIAVGPALVVIGALTLLTRSSGLAAIGALALLVGMALLSDRLDIHGWWGVDDDTLLSWMSLGFALVVAPKHIRDALSPSPSRS